MNDAVARDAVSRILHAYARKHPGMTAVGLLSTLVVPVQDILLPHLTGQVVNAIRAGDGRAMRWSIAWVALAVLGMQLAFVAVDVVDAKLFPSMQKFVRRSMFECLLNTYDSAHSAELPVGEIISKFSRTPPMLVTWFESVKGMLPNLLVYVATTAYFWHIDAWLGAGLLVAVFVSFASLAYNLDHCGDVSAARDDTLHAVHEQLDEVLHNLPAIYAAGTKADEARRIEPVEDRFESLYFRTVMCSNMVKAWMVPVSITMVAGVLWRSYVMLRARRLDVGRFVAIFSVVLYLMASMMRVVAHSKNMVYYWGTVQSSLDLLLCDPGASAPPAASAASASAGDRTSAPRGSLVAMRGVSYAHAGTPSPALRGVDLDVRAGDRLAVVGQMGSGKTTLLKLLLRMVEPTSGSVFWSGVPYRALPTDDVRAHFGYIPQSAPLFDRTVIENAVYGTPAAAAGASEQLARVQAAAHELGLASVFEALPDGLRTRVGKAGSRLSGGQRQAVWILRMALRRPDVLVLDEATASMDAVSQAAVAEAVRRFPTVVVVSHDMSFVSAVATRTVYVSGGRVSDEPPAPAPKAKAPMPGAAAPEGPPAAGPPGAPIPPDASAASPASQEPSASPASSAVPDMWSYDGSWSQDA